MENLLVILSSISLTGVVFVPGILVSFLILSKRDIAWIVSFGFVFDIFMVAVSVLLMDTFGIPITRVSLLIWFWSLDLIIGIFYILRAFLKTNSREFYSFSPRIISKENWEKGLLITSLLVIFIALLPFTLNITRESYTEFYIQSQEGQVPVWRKALKLGEDVPITLVINSHELKGARFGIKVYLCEQEKNSLDLGNILPGETVSKHLNLPANPSVCPEYRIYLTKDNDTNPYRELFFNIQQNQ